MSNMQTALFRVEKQVEFALDFVLAGYQNMVADGQMKKEDLPALSDIVDEVYDELITYTRLVMHGEIITLHTPLPELELFTSESVISLIIAHLYREYVDSDGNLIL